MHQAARAEVALRYKFCLLDIRTDLTSGLNNASK
jgi:hypothetical protein